MCMFGTQPRFLHVLCDAVAYVATEGVQRSLVLATTNSANPVPTAHPFHLLPCQTPHAASGVGKESPEGPVAPLARTNTKSMLNRD